MVFIKITHFTYSTRETIVSSSGDCCTRSGCLIDVAFLPGKRDFRRPLAAFFLPSARVFCLDGQTARVRGPHPVAAG
jgi:hypothetical protein